MPLKRRSRPRRINSFAGCLLDLPFGAFERHVLRAYALTVLRPDSGKLKLEITDELIEWYRENRRTLGFRVEPLDAWLRTPAAERSCGFGNTLRFTARTIPQLEVVAPAPSAFQTRLGWIGRTLDLTPGETAFLGAVARLTQVPAFRELYAAATGCQRDNDEMPAKNAAHIAGLTDREGYRLADHRGALFQLGLIEDRGGGDVALSTTVAAILACRTTDENVLRQALLGKGAASLLDPSDFAHLGTARDHVTALIAAALRRREAGASFLFYGPPGTGKTEFARLIGAALDAQVVFIGETGAESSRQRLTDEPSRADRLSHLAFASALAERTGRTVLVIDEADDVFTGVDDEAQSNRTGSKVFMNRVVETCPVPMIWITNHADRLGPAVLRRMLMALEFREADRQTRLRIVGRHAKAKGVALPQPEIAQLASLPASPALLEAGVRAAGMLEAGTPNAGGIAVAVTRSLLRVAGRDRPVEAIGGPIPFDAALSSADQDLGEIECRVAAAGSGALSFLFSGLPGTGKSAFARHLAERLGLEVMETRASDLLGMYVGESEKRIADAFREAADTRRFLVFDEADSLLGDRAGARHGWEISQVNEMLTWMEHHPLPFAATTNLVQRLDPAVQRRFVFKVAFGAMTARQADEAFRRAFGREAPALVGRLDPLTPGDFAVVARRAKVLGVNDPSGLARMLEAEVAAKPGGGTRIGF